MLSKRANIILSSLSILLLLPILIENNVSKSEAGIPSIYLFLVVDMTFSAERFSASKVLPLSNLIISSSANFDINFLFSAFSQSLTTCSFTVSNGRKVGSINSSRRSANTPPSDNSLSSGKPPILAFIASDLKLSYAAIPFSVLLLYEIFSNSMSVSFAISSNVNPCAKRSSISEIISLINLRLSTLTYSAFNSSLASSKLVFCASMIAFI